VAGSVPLEAEPFIIRVFRAPFLAGRKSGRHESVKVFGRPEGVCFGESA